MTDSIKCPKCSHSFPLTESLAGPLLEAREREFTTRLEKARKEASATAITEATAVASQRIETLQTALLEAHVTKQDELGALQNQVRDQEVKLAAAQQAQAQALRDRRQLEDERRELELTVEKRVSRSLGEVQAKARAEAEDSLRLKLVEKDETLASMSRKIEELKQKAEQGSQQLQGESQEIQLEDTLRAKFPHDTVVPVPKGAFGGDILQTVITSAGLACGTILWESKRTKNWSDTWLPKLRGDQRAANAEVAIIVTSTMPKGVESFDIIEGVWVCGVKTFVPVATVLRQSLISIYTAKQFSDGQQTKAELVYQYLTGAQFKARVEAIVEAFTRMQEDLAKERKAITKHWANREGQLESAINATMGFYGDVQAIAGSQLQQISGIELEALEA